MNEALSILVHASAKVGKSTLASTSPTPILVLDVEGSWRFIREAGFKSGKTLRRVVWDPKTSPPPRHDGTWEYCWVSVTNWRDLTDTYNWLLQTEHDFQSIVIDSITEAQRKLKTNLVGMDQPKIQDWGTLLTHMDKLIRDVRDLVTVTNSPLRCVVFVSETRLENGKWRPYLQGQISVSLPYWVDICAYLFPDTVEDENGQATQRVQKLLIAPHPQYETGERVQGLLPGIITNPDITQMIRTIFPETTSTQEKTSND